MLCRYKREWERVSGCKGNVESKIFRTITLRYIGVYLVISMWVMTPVWAVLLQVVYRISNFLFVVDNGTISKVPFVSIITKDMSLINFTSIWFSYVWHIMMLIWITFYCPDRPDNYIIPVTRFRIENSLSLLHDTTISNSIPVLSPV